ncbi:hypothetical protein J7I97_25390, partial [Streptomyces sp. ISL-87]
ADAYTHTAPTPQGPAPVHGSPAAPTVQAPAEVFAVAAPAAGQPGIPASAAPLGTAPEPGPSAAPTPQGPAEVHARTAPAPHGTAPHGMPPRGTAPAPQGPSEVPARTAPVPRGTAPHGTAPQCTPPEPAPAPQGPAQAFDALYARAAPALVRQVYLLTGRCALAQDAVERAFQQAWERWPEVATDPDPVGWVRAAAHERALSPWHHFRRAHLHPDKAPAEPADLILMDAMLALPPAHRRTVLLYDGVGLDLPDAAAETEASTPTAGHRLLQAHADLADRIPELACVPPEKQSALLRHRLGTLRPAVPLEPRPPAVVRACGEHRGRRWSRAVLGLTAVIAVATAYTATTAPNKYEPPQAPGASVSGVPPLSGPQQLTEHGRELQQKLRDAPEAGPARLAPKVE